MHRAGPVGPRRPCIEPKVPIGMVTEINHNGVTQRRRVLNGRVVDGPDAHDGGSNRSTFSGDAEVFAAVSAPLLQA
jgi:hypothetical protein